MMKIHHHCLYAAFGQTVQSQGWFIVRRNLTSCLQAFRDAQADDATFIVLFADAAYDSSTLVSWSIIRSTESNGAETRVSFDPIHPLPVRKRVSVLRKANNGEPISESIRKGQIVCRTPTFVHALSSSRAQEAYTLTHQTKSQASGAGFGEPEQNSKVEQAAVRIVTEWYQNRGWQVTSVEAQRCGYDLLCRRKQIEAHVEVKGLTGNERRFIITAGEMRHAASDKDFVLALVTKVLSGRHVLEQWTSQQLREEFVFEPIHYWAEHKLKASALPNDLIKADATRSYR